MATQTPTRSATQSDSVRTRASLSKVDHAALKFNQGSIIVLLLLAFIFNWQWMVAFVAAVMLVGSILPRAGLFKWIAQRWVEPAGILRADIRADVPQPHLFAQAIGGIFLAAATIAFLFGATTVGWVLTAIVVVLAAVNLFLGFCAGCFIYFQLGKLGVRPDFPTWKA